MLYLFARVRKNYAKIPTGGTNETEYPILYSNNEKTVN